MLCLTWQVENIPVDNYVEATDKKIPHATCCIHIDKDFEWTFHINEILETLHSESTITPISLAFRHMASRKFLSLNDNNTNSTANCNIKAITTSSHHIIAPTQPFRLFFPILLSVLIIDALIFIAQFV